MLYPFCVFCVLMEEIKGLNQKNSKFANHCDSSPYPSASLTNDYLLLLGPNPEVGNCQHELNLWSTFSYPDAKSWLPTALFLPVRPRNREEYAVR